MWISLHQERITIKFHDGGDFSYSCGLSDYTTTEVPCGSSLLLCFCVWGNFESIHFEFQCCFSWEVVCWNLEFALSSIWYNLACWNSQIFLEPVLIALILVVQSLVEYRTMSDIKALGTSAVTLMLWARLIHVSSDKVVGADPCMLLHCSCDVAFWYWLPYPWLKMQHGHHDVECSSNGQLQLSSDFVILNSPSYGALATLWTLQPLLFLIIGFISTF